MAGWEPHFPSCGVDEGPVRIEPSIRASVGDDPVAGPGPDRCRPTAVTALHHLTATLGVDFDVVGGRRVDGDLDRVGGVDVDGAVTAGHVAASDRVLHRRDPIDVLRHREVPSEGSLPSCSRGPRRFGK